jgi:hypothetical protein
MPRYGNTSTLFQNVIEVGGFETFISDYNVWCNPYPFQPYTHRVYVIANAAATSYTLPNWRTYSGGLDAHSTGIYGTYTTPKDTIFINPSLAPLTVTLSRQFKNLDGTVQTSPFVVEAYGSKILIDDQTGAPPVPPPATAGTGKRIFKKKR